MGWSKIWNKGQKGSGGRDLGRGRGNHRRCPAGIRAMTSAIAVCMVLGMAACGGKEDGEPDSGSVPENTSAPEVTATAVPAEPTPEPTPEATPDPSETIYGENVPTGKYAPAESYSDRAMVAVKAADGVFVSWRSYEADSDKITFTLSRNDREIYTGSLTNYMDK